LFLFAKKKRKLVSGWELASRFQPIDFCVSPEKLRSDLSQAEEKGGGNDRGEEEERANT
jgi:hypothetical protein